MMGPAKCEELLHSWEMWGRPSQQWAPDPAHRYTVVTAGRGWGKTRFASEQCHLMADKWQAECGGEIGIAGRTHDDAIKDLIEGPSGILKTQKPWNKCRVFKDAIQWDNGTVGYLLTGDKPQKFRGKNLGFLWCDEFAHWQYPQECQDAFEFSVRRGTCPSIIITSTPIPHPTFIRIARDPATLLIEGSTLENSANIGAATLRRWVEKYRGTDLELQELQGKILDTNRNALWQHHHILRMVMADVPGLMRTVVSVDPAGGSTHKKSDETGIIVAAVCEQGRGYVLADRSGRMPATDWAGMAISLARRHGADRIVGESNFGGDMVRTTIVQHPDWPAAAAEGIGIAGVRAVKSKGHRAQPLAARYQQGRVFHIGEPREFLELEHQMTHYDPDIGRGRQKSPDRMDALVHAFAELFPDRDGLQHSSMLMDESAADVLSSLWQS